MYGKDINFTILDTINSSGVYKLVPVGSIKSIVNLFRPKFYYNKYKIVPEEILNSTFEIRKYFFIGYYAADGYKCNNTNTKNICFSNKGKIGSSQLFYICKTIGYNVSICIRDDKPDVYKLTCSINKQRKPSNILKKMVYLRNSDEEYVYDLETEQGNYNAGVGELNLFNTDSVFFKFNPKDPISNEKIIGKKRLKLQLS